MIIFIEHYANIKAILKANIICIYAPYLNSADY